eukprot:scaffold24096_cov64-Phaeocystis_antarctica.AAC.16
MSSAKDVGGRSMVTSSLLLFRFARSSFSGPKYTHSSRGTSDNFLFSNFCMKNSPETPSIESADLIRGGASPPGPNMAASSLRLSASLVPLKALPTKSSSSAKFVRGTVSVSDDVDSEGDAWGTGCDEGTLSGARAPPLPRAPRVFSITAAGAASSAADGSSAPLPNPLRPSAESISGPTYRVYSPIAIDGLPALMPKRSVPLSATCSARLESRSDFSIVSLSKSKVLRTSFTPSDPSSCNASSTASTYESSSQNETRGKANGNGPTEAVPPLASEINASKGTSSGPTCSVTSDGLICTHGAPPSVTHPLSPTLCATTCDRPVGGGETREAIGWRGCMARVPAITSQTQPLPSPNCHRLKLALTLP